jgi:DNA-directed RNA polymerase specialized sigma subunit
MFDLETEYRVYRPLVLKMYRTFAKKTMEQDDFEQEARIVLWRTLKTYDENRKWS